MRLIDADKLCEEFKSRQNAALNWKEQAIMNDDLEVAIRADAILTFLSEVKLTIDNAPTVKQTIGEWYYVMNSYICSKCNCQVDTEWNYCPDCGAYMI